MKEKPESTVKDRLLQFLKAERISKAEFARRMGLSVAYVSAMRKSLPEDKVVKLTQLFPNINRDWLLYGEGEMYRPAETRPAHAPALDPDWLVPLLPVEACAGNLQLYSQSVAMRDCEWIPTPVKGADFAIQVTGDSMEPKIHDGTIAAIVRINDRAFIPWGNPMVIDTENGVLIKTVYPSGKGEKFIEARSVNPQYPPLTIPRDSVFGLYRIVAYTRRISNY